MVRAVRKAYAKTLIVKLSPNVTSITDIAKAVEAEGAGLGTLAALDALILVNEAAAVDEGNGPLGADLLAGGGQAVLAAHGDLVLIFRAGVEFQL